jgi:hypothetical protein
VQTAGDFTALGAGIHYFPPFVIATLWANLVRLLHLMAVGAFGQRRSGQKVVRAPLVLAGFRMTSFWIGHANSFLWPLIEWSILWCFPVDSYCFLNQSCFKRDKGAIRGSET